MIYIKCISIIDYLIKFRTIFFEDCKTGYQKNFLKSLFKTNVLKEVY